MPASRMADPWRVLIVEDERDVARVHCLTVARLPRFKVVGVASDAVAALTMCENLRPHLLLLDMQLPGADGTMLLRKLRSLGLGIEAIGVSGIRSARTVRMALQLGVVDYIIKPCGPDRLIEALEAFLRRMEMFERDAVAQAHIDDISGRAAERRRALPGGLVHARLVQVRSLIASEPLTATDVAARTGMARRTASRYLEYLALIANAEVSEIRDGPGRPRKQYASPRREPADIAASRLSAQSA